MTTLTITPSFQKKTARFHGAIAAGEHVAVTIQNDGGYVESTAHLRLNVIDPATGRLLATFPQPAEEGEPPEEWDSDLTPLSCIINLNTVQMLDAVPPQATVRLLFVLDDYESKILYFKDCCEVTHWPRRVGEEEPVNLDDYADLISDFGDRLTEAEGDIADAITAVNAAVEQVAASAQDASNASAAAGRSEIAANSAASKAQGAKTAAELAAASAASMAETKADKATTYTKTEVDSLVASTGGKFIVVAELPGAATADRKAIYLVPRGTAETDNIYDEYVVVEPTTGTLQWDKIGSTVVDLSDYYNKTAADARFVQQESGKGLSSNDYTTAEKQKLAGVEAGAQANAVVSVNGKTGAVVLGASAVGAAAAAILQRFESNTDFALILERNNSNGNLLYVTERGTGGDGPFIFNTANAESANPDYRPCVVFGGPFGPTFAYLNDIAPQFSELSTYAVGELVSCYKINDGDTYPGSYLFKCTTAVTEPGAWDASKWTRATVEDILSALRAAVASKLDSTSAAPAFDATATYAVDEHCTYNGKLYKCTTAVTVAGPWTGTTNWTQKDMTSPDATLDVTSQDALRVVAADGTQLWMQGYNLVAPTVTSSAATASNESVNYIAFAANAAGAVTLSLPARTTGKVSDFVLEVYNPALDSTAANYPSAFSDSATYAVGDRVLQNNAVWVCTVAVETAGAWTGTSNWQTACLAVAGLDTTISIVVPDGEDLQTMFTIAPGEMSEFYFTLTQFAVNSRPTYKVVKQAVINGGGS